MAYVVDRVVICDAFREPDRHYELLPGGKSKLVPGRRPSMRFLASAKDVKGGIAGVVGREAGLFEDILASSEQRNDFVNRRPGAPRSQPSMTVTSSSSAPTPLAPGRERWCSRSTAGRRIPKPEGRSR